MRSLPIKPLNGVLESYLDRLFELVEVNEAQRHMEAARCFGESTGASRVEFWVAGLRCECGGLC
eukprot:2501283-Pyramimonas_sp.AAC.2